MSADRVKVFARLRPRLEREKGGRSASDISANINKEIYKLVGGTRVEVNKPIKSGDDGNAGIKSGDKRGESGEGEKYVFNYDGVLGPECSQDDVWNALDMDTVMAQALEGYH